MSIQKQFKTIVFTVLTAALLFWGCESSIDSGTEGTGTMLVKLHDAPVDYDEVNISIARVEVNNTESEGEGWTTISEPNETYNILDLVNGEFEILADAELEVGTYKQIRLILNNDENTVVIDGESHDLYVPSGVQTGVKLNIDAEIREGIVYTLLLDFDANRSVVKKGATNQYNLQPVIRATNEAVTGNISGTIAQAEARAAVFAISDSDTLSTTFADTASGEFMLVGLPEGSYDVSIEAREEGYESDLKSDVQVTLGETYDLGEIELNSSDE